ncbi:hypothetical protein MMC13_008129 [Lambiella insularis]|nr:hypothetical protein [Lambiella insularis]
MAMQEKEKAVLEENSNDNLKVQESCFLLQLPLELRLMIYGLVLECADSRTIVCCWEVSGELPFTSAILLYTRRTISNWEAIQLGLFQACRSVSNEARLMFYRKNIFRFNSDQLVILLRMPHVLEHLRRIEIEDTSSVARTWNVELMLDRLSPLLHLDSIVVGARVSGNSSWLTDPLSTLRYRRLWTVVDEVADQPCDKTASREERERVRASSWVNRKALSKWVAEGYGVSYQDWHDFRYKDDWSTVHVDWCLNIPLFPNIMLVDYFKLSSLSLFLGCRVRLTPEAAGHVAGYWPSWLSSNRPTHMTWPKALTTASSMAFEIR